MCYICKRPAHQVFGKTALRLKEIEKSNPEVLETELLSTIWIEEPEFKEDFSEAEIEYWTKRNELSRRTSFRFRFDIFNKSEEDTCPEHVEALKALIEYGWVVVVEKDGAPKRTKELSFFEDLK